MRADNPIYDHWFKFPDLAEFPDYANEDRNTDDVNLDPFYLAYNNNDITTFIAELAKYTDVTLPWVGKLKQFFQMYQNYHPHSVMQSTNDLCGYDLYEYGLHITNVDFSDLDLSDLIKKELNKPDWKSPPGQYDRGVQLGKEYLQIIQNKFMKAGIIQGSSMYSGNVKTVANALLHISTPTDDHYKQFFRDATTTPRWTNTHIDPKENVVKAIVYLEDIGIDNGGFGYVPTSNRFVYDPLQNIFGRAICTGNYCRTPEERKSIFSLPSKFRVSHNFGRCILDDSDIAKKLDENFTRITSDMGNVAVFDAGAGMHQGGIVKEGRRVALQVLMK